MSDSTTNLDTILSSQSEKEVLVNELLDAASPATAFGRHGSACAALVWAYYGGVIPGSATRKANGTISLTPSATNYLYFTSTGTVTKVTSAPAGWPNALSSGATAMAEIIAGASTVTSYKDWRPSFGSSGGGGSTPVFIGQDDGSPIRNSVTGTVPAAAPGDQAAGKVLYADGIWRAISVDVTPAPIQVACSDQITPLSVDSPISPAVIFRAPGAITLSAVRASLAKESSSGAVTVDVKVNGASVFSTLLTIDASEKTSTTAATPAVISNPTISDDDEIAIYIVGSGTNAMGLVVTLLAT